MLMAVTANQLAESVSLLKPGQGVIYHVGHLHGADKQAQAIAHMARQLSDMTIPDAHGSLYVGMGLVTLVQRRVGEGFQYIAVRLGRKDLSAH